MLPRFTQRTTPQFDGKLKHIEPLIFDAAIGHRAHGRFFAGEADRGTVLCLFIGGQPGRHDPPYANDRAYR